jgi:hypothetical protein
MTKRRDFLHSLGAIAALGKTRLSALLGPFPEQIDYLNAGLNAVRAFNLTQAIFNEAKGRYASETEMFDNLSLKRQNEITHATAVGWMLDFASKAQGYALIVRDTSEPKNVYTSDNSGLICQGTFNSDEIPPAGTLEEGSNFPGVRPWDQYRKDQPQLASRFLAAAFPQMSCCFYVLCQDICTCSDCASLCQDTPKGCYYNCGTSNCHWCNSAHGTCCNYCCFNGMCSCCP